MSGSGNHKQHSERREFSRWRGLEETQSSRRVLLKAGTMTSSISCDNQDKLLDEATAVVKEQAFYMKKAMDKENLRDTLKHASNMICELRTSLLGPKTYYELYMLVFQELQTLSVMFAERAKKDPRKKVSDMYESVQHAGNILPRLYLLATVGVAYIDSKEDPAAVILNDVSELCKGVQHPMRGLFLRYYVSQMCRDRLPDKGSRFETPIPEDGVQAAFEFLRNNLAESTSLWVRMQHQGTTKDKQKREKERHDLRVLIGTSLVRMSQLEGMTLQFYTSVALSSILKTILATEDPMAQQYLMDCIIQVFPDEFHLSTLGQFLGACGDLHPAVDLKQVMVNLMTRLGSFLANNPEGSAAASRQADGDGRLFRLFQGQLDQIMLHRASGVMEHGPVLDLMLAFTQFTLMMYPDRQDFLHDILRSTCAALAATGRASQLPPDCSYAACELLALPLRKLPLSVLLSIPYFHTLMQQLRPRAQKQAGVEMLKAVLESMEPSSQEEGEEGEEKALGLGLINQQRKKCPDMDSFAKFLSFVGGVLQQTEDNDGEIDADELRELEVAGPRLLSQVMHSDLVMLAEPDLAFEMVKMAGVKFSEASQEKVLVLLPTLVVVALRILTERVLLPSSTTTLRPKKVLEFVHRLLSGLTLIAPLESIRLWLLAAETSARGEMVTGAGFGKICQEFFTQALMAYEQHITDGAKQLSCLYLLMGTLPRIGWCLPPPSPPTSPDEVVESEYEAFARKIAQFSSKILKAQDKCRAIFMVSRVFWGQDSRTRNPERVVQCLQRGIKLADSCISSSPGDIGLLVEILEQYIGYFDEEVPGIGPEFINHLLTLISEHISFGSANAAIVEEVDAAKAHLLLCVNHLKGKKADPDTADSCLMPSPDLQTFQRPQRALETNDGLNSSCGGSRKHRSNQNEEVEEVWSSFDFKVAQSVFSHLRLLAYELATGVGASTGQSSTFPSPSPAPSSSPPLGSSTSSFSDAVDSLIAADSLENLSQGLIDFWFHCASEAFEKEWTFKMQNEWLEKLFLIILGCEKQRSSSRLIISLRAGFCLLRDSIFTLQHSLAPSSLAWSPEQLSSWAHRLREIASPITQRSAYLSSIAASELEFTAQLSPVTERSFPSSWMSPPPSLSPPPLQLFSSLASAVGSTARAVGGWIQELKDEFQGEEKGLADKLTKESREAARSLIIRKIHPIHLINGLYSSRNEGVKLSLYPENSLACMVPVGGLGEGVLLLRSGETGCLRPPSSANTFFAKISATGVFEQGLCSSYVKRGECLTLTSSPDGVSIVRSPLMIPEANAPLYPQSSPSRRAGGAYSDEQKRGAERDRNLSLNNGAFANEEDRDEESSPTVGSCLPALGVPLPPTYAEEASNSPAEHNSDEKKELQS